VKPLFSTHAFLRTTVAILLVASVSSVSKADKAITKETVISAVNQSLHSDGCKISNGIHYRNVHLGGGGKPEILAYYGLSADVCQGGGSWANDEIALLEPDGHRLIVKSRVVPGRDGNVIDAFIQRIRVTGHKVQVRVKTGTPGAVGSSMGGPVTVTYRYVNGQLVLVSK
jgi:hypothetical protein